MSRALNDALSICDRAGRKRRRGDFVLSVRVRDIAGGKLGSGAGDEGRLRVQKRRCVWIEGARKCLVDGMLARLDQL